jgi:hypothetical protein
MKEGPVFCIAVFAVAKGLIVAVYSYLSHIGMSVKEPYQRRKPQLKDLSSRKVCCYRFITIYTIDPMLRTRRTVHRKISVRSVWKKVVDAVLLAQSTASSHDVPETFSYRKLTLKILWNVQLSLLFVKRITYRSICGECIVSDPANTVDEFV